VKVDDATTGASVVTLPDFIALQNALRPRWEQVCSVLRVPGCLTAVMHGVDFN
jgi:hypothetical protein